MGVRAIFLRDKPVKRMAYLYEHAFDRQHDNREGGFFLTRLPSGNLETIREKTLIEIKRFRGNGEKHKRNMKNVAVWAMQTVAQNMRLSRMNKNGYGN